MKRTFLPIAAVVSVIASGPVLAQTYGTGTPQGNVVPGPTAVITAPSSAAVVPAQPVAAPGMVHDERDLKTHIGRAEFAAQLQTEDQVARIVKEAYGSNVHHGGQLDEATLQMLTPGNMMPTTVREQSVPSRISGELPHSQSGTRWARVGNNLVEIAPTGEIVTTVYDVVPAS
ncbi:hypothetical protein [Oceanicella sp. SM1341]|uniref:hypothetical protein n=1 Tax=Oceanicella sp. SM1341 TaxID=1548889 RepID=UPI000E46B215|nr:hypothetical protein [Oceanicella sp. SM1341]